MSTSLHLLPEEAYPFTLLATYRDEGRVLVAWAITALSPRGANPMELSSFYIPPLKDWTGHEVEMTMVKPDEFWSTLEAVLGG